MKKILIVLGVLVIVFSAFIAYAYYYNPRIYILCCAPYFGEEYTTEFVDRDFLFRFASDGGFGGSSLTIKINGDGTFERATIPFLDLENTKIEKGRLSRQDMLLLVNRIESSNFFNLPEKLENLDCYDAPATSLTIGLDGKSHTISEYCSFFDNPEGDRYHSLLSLVSQMTTKGGYRK